MTAALELRTIEPDELVEWVGAFQVPFLDTSSTNEGAEFRRKHIDFERTWGAFDGQRIVGTLRSFATELTTPGCGSVKADAVTAVSVRPTHRRRGLMTRLIETSLRKAAERQEAVSILIAAEYPIYGRFGYGAATEHATYTLETQRAHFPGPPQGRVDIVSAEAARPIAPEIYERYRRQQPGAIGRDDHRWDADLGLAEFPGRERWKGFCGVYRDDEGQPQGFLQYHVDSRWDQRVPRNKIVVDELLSVTPEAHTGLWRFLAELDLVEWVEAENRPVDEPLYWKLTDARALRQTLRADLLWVRILDLQNALANRGYLHSGQAVLEVVDPLGYASGCFAVELGPEGASCSVTTQSADVTLSAGALGAAYLGGSSLAIMHRAGVVDEHRPGAVAQLDGLLHTRPAPFCNTWF